MNDLLNNASAHSLIVMTAENFQKALDAVYARAKQAAVEDLDARSQKVAEPLIAKQEAMQTLGKSANTLWKWARRGYLKPVKVGGRVMYRVSDLHKITEREVKGNEK